MPVERDAQQHQRGQHCHREPGAAVRHRPGPLAQAAYLVQGLPGCRHGLSCPEYSAAQSTQERKGSPSSSRARQDGCHGVPHRARHDGRGPGPEGRAVASPDPARGRQLPDLGYPPGAPAHPSAGPDQGRCRDGERRSGRARPSRRRGDRRSGGRRGRGPPRRPVPDRRVPDRLRHLMDATPVTLGQEFSGYAAQVRYGIERLQSTLPRLAELPLGGTAVGTGINTPAGFARLVIERLARETGLPLTEARNHFEAQGARDALVEVSGQLRTIAVGLYKMANDIRWMGSGPRAGLRELHIPDLQPGSSIMPGKVNPVVCEAVRQVSAQVLGNDAAVGFAGSQGDFELNVMLPVIARNLLESIRLLAAVSRLFADRCVAGLEANVALLKEYAESSPAIVTPLNRYLGYDEAAAIAKQALNESKTIRQVVIERGHVAQGHITEEQLDESLDVLRMTHP